MKIHGLKELEEKLRQLEPKIAKKALSSAMREAFKPVLNAARAKAPKDTGLLKRRIKMALKVDKGGTMIVGLYLSSKPDTLGKGSSANKLNKGGRVVRKKEARNWAWYEKGIPSRGIPAKPFFRPALDSNQALVVSILQTKLKAALEDLVKEK